MTAAAFDVLGAGLLRLLLAAGLLAALALVGYGLLPRWRASGRGRSTDPAPPGLAGARPRPSTENGTDPMGGSVAWLRRPGKAEVALPLAISVGMLATGWAGWVAGTAFGTRAVWVVWVVLLALGARAGGDLWRDAGRVFRRLLALGRSAPLLAAAFAAAALLLVPALFLPLLDSDGIRYQVAHPKLYLLTGEVSTYRWDVTGYFPQLAPMLYLVATALGGGEACKLVHAGFALLSAAALALLVHRGKRTRTAAVAAALLAFVAPVAAAPATAAFVDHVGLFHLLAAALLVAARAPAPLAGLALGAAFATKMTTAPFLAGLAIAAVAVRPATARLREAGLLVAVLVLTYLPFGLRNLILTKDPFFPLGHGLAGIPIPGVAKEGLEWAVSYREEARGLLAVGFLPFQEGLAWDDVAGPQALLGLVAVVVLVRERRLRFLLLPILFSLAAASFWHPPARYFLPLFAALAALLAVALSRAGPRVLTAAALVLAGVSAWASARELLFGFSALDHLAGRVPGDEVKAATIPGYRAARFVNGLPGGRVMALDFPGPFYFDRPWVVEGVLNEPPLRRWLGEGADGEGLLARCEALGVTHLLVTPGWGGGTKTSLYPLARSRREAEAVVAFRSRLRLVATVDGVDVFELPAR